MDEACVYEQLLQNLKVGDVESFKEFISKSGGFKFKTLDFDKLSTLTLAACSADIGLLKLLTERVVDLNTVNSYGDTILLGAIKEGRFPEALALIDACVDVDMRDYNGDNALIVATRLDAVEVVRKLLVSGVGTACLDSKGESPLGIAHATGKVEVVRAFVECGHADDEIDMHGDRLLISASRSGDIDLMRFLIQSNADLCVQNRNLFSPLISAVQNGHFEIVEILVNAGSPLDSSNKYGDTALTVACRDGHTPIVGLLLDHGASVEEGGWMRITPLMQAAFHGQLDIVHELLQRGADVNAINVDGDSALNSLGLARHGLVHDVCQMLVAHGADVNLADKHGSPPLIKAIASDNTAFALGLISLGAQVDFVILTTKFKLRHKETPLILASRLGRMDILRCLLKNGADVNAKNRYDRTALSVATSNTTNNNTGEIVSLLIGAGVDIEHVDADGMTPLMLASSNGLVSAVRSILDAGASVNQRHFIADHSALYYATLGKHHEVVGVLMASGAQLRNELHVAIKCGSRHVVRTMVQSGAMPTRPVESPHNVEKDLFPECSKSPLITSLLCKDVSTALYLMSIWFFNAHDVGDMKLFKHILSKKADKFPWANPARDLVTRMSRQPKRLMVLTFVAVSSAVGFQSGRAQRVNDLNVPKIFKKRLLFQDDDVQLPVDEWDNLTSLETGILL